MTISDFYIEPIYTDLILLNVIRTHRFGLSEITGRWFLFPYKSIIYWGAFGLLAKTELDYLRFLLRSFQLFAGLEDYGFHLSVCSF